MTAVATTLQTLRGAKMQHTYHVSLTLLLFLMSTGRVVPFLLKQSGRRFECLRMVNTPKKIAIEVEEKFQLVDGGTNVEKRLMELGFEKKGEIDIVDWYFDTPDPHWTLTPRDYWLRYRDTKQSSSWQLKRGRRHHEGGATVYEELENNDAIKAIMELLPSKSQGVIVPDEYKGYAVPALPRPLELIPFARIETHRSSWKFSGNSESYNDLTVDLDGTQYDYMVGEVEAVVFAQDEVPLARQRIELLVRELVPTQDDASSQVPVGKLEHYLIRHRPDHYKACIEGGSIKER